MNQRDLPIGIMDSGMGGLSVLREAVRLMPQEDFIYYGDSANAPYGTRTVEEIRELTENCVRYLIGRGVKEIIIACNTATSAAAAYLREKYADIPIIGIEPAMKPAVMKHPGGNILITGTEVTLREQKFRDQLKIYEKQANINLQPLGGIVGFVEQGKADSPELEKYLRETLSPWAEQGLDALVLGCTHFPFVKEQIRCIVGPRTEILDGAEGTVREAMRQFEIRGLLQDVECVGTMEICQSGNDEAWKMRAEQLLGAKVEIVRRNDEARI